MKAALTDRYLPEHVGLRVPKPTRESARERLLSLEEVRTVFDASKGLGPLWGPVVRLLLLTGQRRGEIISLRWEEVDLERARFTKAGRTTKSKKPHVTLLSGPAFAELEALGGERTGLVFTTTGKTPVSGISNAKKRLDGLLGDDFEPWRLHDIRTAMATALAEAGEPKTIMDRILNHVASGSAPSAVATVYTHAEQLPQRAKGLDRWADMVTGKTGEVVSLRG